MAINGVCIFAGSNGAGLITTLSSANPVPAGTKFIDVLDITGNGSALGAGYFDAFAPATNSIYQSSASNFSTHIFLAFF